jgi:hypothetical protein
LDAVTLGEIRPSRSIDKTKQHSLEEEEVQEDSETEYSEEDFYNRPKLVMILAPATEEKEEGSLFTT